MTLLEPNDRSKNRKEMLNLLAEFGYNPASIESNRQEQMAKFMVDSLHGCPQYVNPFPEADV